MAFCDLRIKKGMVIGMRLTASLACANYLNLEKDILELLDGGIKQMHIDIMDGRYVPNLAFNFDMVSQIKKRFPELELDSHIMAEDPSAFIKPLADAGVSSIDFHISATDLAYSLINRIKSMGIRAGAAINPCESQCLLDPVLNYIDRVLVMSVEPGFAGQCFIPDTFIKIAELDRKRKERGSSYEIIIDGGVNIVNGKECLENGGDSLVLGVFAVFNQPEGITAASRKVIDALCPNKKAYQL